jgi:hypothetical protein
MKKDNKREIEILVERIKYLESIIQDNIMDINMEDLKTWSEEEVINTIEDKDKIILHLKERIKDMEKEDMKNSIIEIMEGDEELGLYDQSDILEMKIWDSTLMDGLDDDQETENKER